MLSGERDTVDEVAAVDLGSSIEDVLHVAALV